jgi:hypothetical protein
MSFPAMAHQYLSHIDGLAVINSKNPCHNDLEIIGLNSELIENQLAKDSKIYTLEKW